MRTITYRAIGREPDPVPRVLVRAEDELEAAVGRELEVAVVAVGEDRAVDAAGRVGSVDRERDVGLAGPPARHPVRAVTTDDGLLVERVRVVAEELAGRRDDRREARAVGIGLDEQLRGFGEQLRDVPEPLDDVELVGEPLRGQDVLVADLREQVDELVEGRGGLRRERHRWVSISRGPWRRPR